MSRSKQDALQGSVTQVAKDTWCIGVGDAQGENPWLALQVFDPPSEFAARAHQHIGLSARVTPNAPSGTVNIKIAGTTDTATVLKFLRDTYPTYNRRTINWKEGSPPEMTVCPTY